MDPSEYAEIAQLLARYCHIVDGKQWDRLLEIFADDGTMTVTGLYATHRGDAELRVLYGEVMNHPLAHHSTSVVVLESAGATARAVSNWVTVRADGLTGTGVYADDLVRTEQGWRIAARVATPDSLRS
jgi:3-phenylpropionate/cinnamic acid dioxygenase small subunit